MEQRNRERREENTNRSPKPSAEPNQRSPHSSNRNEHPVPSRSTDRTRVDFRKYDRDNDLYERQSM
ncbi:MAG TPA: hypothetical protein VHK91_17245 [Flavisolibacter sp.]|nr:hypothetical protein [Flavisolibacter sp.]